MSITYRNEIASKQTDSFSVSLTETADVFKQKHGISIIGRDFEDILTSSALYEEYVARFTEGMEATEAEQIQTFANSFRETCLQESLAGVQPYASLTMPVLVKLWARLSIKYAIPTEPVSQPAFTIAFMKPYILDDVGDKHYLPEELSLDKTLADMPKVAETVTLTDGKVEGFDLTTGTLAAGKAGVGLFNVDKKFSVVGITVGGKEYACNIKLDLYRRLYGEVTTEGGVVILFGSVDLENCTITLATMGAAEVEAVKVLGWFSSENHTHATEVGFDMSRKDIEIGTATHIEASLPIELLQDTKAMYQIDGAAEVTDIMSNVCAQKVDMEIYNFLDKSFLETKEGNGIKFINDFDVYPQGNFAVNPSEWLNELRKLIDYQATNMRNFYKTYNGYYVILGNPINTMLIPNVSWSFNSVNDTQNGVEVSYSIGALSGANRYTIISSDLIDADDGLTIIFVPTTDKFKTFAYYPYTFNVVQNYLNARTPNVPSIMLTKRQTVEEFQRIIGRINIYHNDGTVYVRDSKED